MKEVSDEKPRNFARPEEMRVIHHPPDNVWGQIGIATQ